VQPWSPDDLLAEASAAVAVVAAEPGEGFAPLEQEPVSRDLDFVEDHPSNGLNGFLSRLTPEERASLYQLVEAEITERVREELTAENAQWRRQQAALLEQVAEQWRQQQRRDLDQIASRSVELAIAMAERMLYCRLQVDREALLRSLETLVYRAPRGTAFTLLVNPEDVDWLQEHAADLAALNIEEIRSERRVSPGGCLVTTDGQEWDFTVKGRFEKLAMVVREALLGDSRDGLASGEGGET